MLQSKTIPILLFLVMVGYLTLFFQLGSLPFVGADEPRYARIAEEMVEFGDPITPTLEGRPWLEKPPFLYWIVGASYRVFGVSEWSARLPVALCGAVAALLVGFLASRMFDPRTGLLSGLILLTSPLFIGLSRSATTDLPFCMALTGALALGFLSIREPRLVWAILSGALLGVAVLAKGPLGLILFGMIWVFYFLYLGRLPLSPLKITSMAVSFLMVAVPWYWEVWRQNGFDFVLTFWLNHHIARFISDLHHHEQSIVFYPIVLSLGFFPWVFFLWPAARQTWSRRKDLIQRNAARDEVFLWIWALAPLLFFSAASSKLAGYILPVFPALAILAGIQWNRFLAVELAVYRQVKKQIGWIRAVCFVLAAALPLFSVVLYDSLSLGLLLAAPLLAGATALGLRFGRAQPANVYLTVVAMMTLFFAGAFSFAAPVFGVHHSSRDLLRPIQDEISQAEPLIFYRYFHHTARYYTGYRTTPASIESLDELSNYLDSHPQERYRIVTKHDGWKDLHHLFKNRLIRRLGNLYLVEITPRSG